MVKVLLIIEIIILLLLICFFCIKRGKFFLNHISCFLIGFVFYILIPIFLCEFRILFSDKTYINLLDMYERIPESNVVYCLVVAFCWVLSFIMGCSFKHIVFRVKKSSSTDKDKYDTISQKLSVFFLPLILLVLIVIYTNRTQFFSGYLGDNVNFLTRGRLSAVLLLVFDFAILAFFSNKKNNLKWSTRLWLGFYGIYALILLTTGGRLYVISNVMALIIAITFVEGKGIRMRNLVLIGFILVLFVGFIGLKRSNTTGWLEGSGYISNMIYNVLQEPLYTSISLVSFMYGGNIIHFFPNPGACLSLILNLIPSRLFPNKGDFIVKTSDLDKAVQNPIGATNMFTSYNLFLGFVGGILFFFIIGYFLSRLERKRDNILYKSMYVMVSSHMLFTFYRDQLEVSLIKNIVEFSVLIPIMIILLSKTVPGIGINKAKSNCC